MANGQGPKAVIVNPKHVLTGERWRRLQGGEHASRVLGYLLKDNYGYLSYTVACISGAKLNCS